MTTARQRSRVFSSNEGGSDGRAQDHHRQPEVDAGRRFPADPPRVDEIIAVMKTAGESAYGLRLRALIVVLWRAGLRISADLLGISEPKLRVRTRLARLLAANPGIHRARCV